MIYLHPWASLKQTFPIRKSEWYAAGLVLGVWAAFAFNDTLFADFRGYDRMALFAPQYVWQWACFLVGFGRITALFVNGAYWRTPHARAAFAFLSCYLWYQMAMAFAGNGGVAVVFAAGTLVLDVFNFRQAFLEAAASQGLRDGERKRARPLG